MTEYTCAKCGHQTCTVYLGGCPMCGTFAPLACLERARFALKRLICVANLFLARMNSRRSELSVRLALGASWRALLVDLLAESFLLTGLATQLAPAAAIT